MTSHSDQQRVEALRQYDILDTPGEATFDIITAMLSEMLGVPHACVSLVDSHRVWFKSAVGIDVPEVEREAGFCASLVTSDAEVLHLEDARIEPPASENSLVCGAPGIRFYAGAPLCSPEGHRIGTLCAFGPEPRKLDETEGITLRRLATLVMHEIELRSTQRALERTEAALRQAQRLESIGLVASGVAHDFNNLLSGILGNAELLRRQLAGNPPGLALLAEIQMTGRRAADLVGQVLAYAGRDRDSPVVPTDLNAVIQETQHMLDASVGNRVTVDLELANDLPSVLGQSTGLRQLVMNLLTNATEACGRAGGNIKIVTLAANGGESVLLTVSDNGSGMPEEVRERIFEPFFSSKSGGRGLGLAICHRIVEQHGGSIQIESKLGLGTEFRITLPASQQPAIDAEDDQQESQEVNNGGEGLVLVVDDEPIICEIARRCLEDAGYNVLLAGGGAEAIEMLDTHHSELSAMVLDWSMPEVNGEQVLAAMSQRRMSLPVVMASGHTERDARESLKPYAVDSFLKKPFRLDELIVQIKIAQSQHNHSPRSESAN